MGNPVVSFSIVVVVAMIEVGVMGAMNMWNLQLNPVSLVNLLMALGISIGMLKIQRIFRIFVKYNK